LLSGKKNALRVDDVLNGLFLNRGDLHGHDWFGISFLRRTAGRNQQQCDCCQNKHGMAAA